MVAMLIRHPIDRVGDVYADLAGSPMDSLFEKNQRDFELYFLIKQIVQKHITKIEQFDQLFTEFRFHCQAFFT